MHAKLATIFPNLKLKPIDLIHERAEKCPCGSVFMAIDHIEGRSDDVLIFGETKIFPDFFRYAILFASDAIENFQLIQINDFQLIIKIKTPNNFAAITDKVVENVQSLLNKNGVTHVQITIKTWDEQDFFNKFRRMDWEQ